RLVDADAEPKEALIIALAVEIAARIAVLAGEQLRGRDRPRPLDIEDGVAVADRATTAGDDGADGRHRQRECRCERGQNPHQRASTNLPISHVGPQGTT